MFSQKLNKHTFQMRFSNFSQHYSNNDQLSQYKKIQSSVTERSQSIVTQINCSIKQRIEKQISSITQSRMVICLAYPHLCVNILVVSGQKCLKEPIFPWIWDLFFCNKIKNTELLICLSLVRFMLQNECFGQVCDTNRMFI